jgi:hypothetical protein
MSFKNFSTKHNEPASPISNPKSTSDIQPGPVFDQPPASPSKAPEEKRTGNKP